MVVHVKADGPSESDSIPAAREAYERREWAAAYRGCADLDGTVSLPG